MEHTPPAKVPITLRIAVGGVAWLDTLAHDYRITRAEVVRAALVVARRYPAEVKKVIEERT